MFSIVPVVHIPFSLIILISFPPQTTLLLPFIHTYTHTPTLSHSYATHTEIGIFKPCKYAPIPSPLRQQPITQSLATINRVVSPLPRQATPILQNKRRTFAHKIRPQSVVENLSLSHLPTLLDSPGSRRSSNASNGATVGGAVTPTTKNATAGSGSAVGGSRAANLGADDEDEEDELGNCDSITELPSASFQLQHLVKGRPKRTKTRAPSRPLITEPAHVIGEGLETFFGPGSLTPTTLTPLISPTSDECSSLSFVDSPTLSRCDEANGRHYFSSEETTPVLEDRKPIAKPTYQSSPLLKGVAWTPRSISSDHLEKYSPAAVSQKSPLLKAHTKTSASDIGKVTTATVATSSSVEQQQRVRVSSKIFNNKNARTPSNESIKSVEADLMLSLKAGESRTPVLPPKPRPWSVAGNEGKCEFANNASALTTPEALDASEFFFSHSRFQLVL